MRDTVRLFLQHAIGRFGSQPFRVAGVWVDQDRVAVVQAVHGLDPTGPSVEKVFSLDLSPQSGSEKAEALKDHWVREGIQSDELILAFPQQEAILKTLALPSTDPLEIQHMVRLQAARFTPLPIEDLTIATQLLGEKPDGYSQVRVALVRKEELERPLALLKAAGLSPKRIVLDALVSLPLIHGSPSPQPSPIEGEGVSWVIEFQRRATSFGIFQESHLLAVRSVPRDCLQRAALEQEMMRTGLSVVEASRPPADAPIFITGTPDGVAAGREVLESLGFSQVQEVHSSQRFPFFKEAGREDFADWPALAAAVMNPFMPAASPNLISERQSSRQATENRWRQAAGVATCAFIFLSLLGGSLLWQYRAKQRTLRRLTEAGAGLAVQVKDLRRMEQELDATRARKNQPGSLIHLLAELNRRVPEQVTLRSVEFERDGALVLQGDCLSVSKAVHLVEILQKSALFSRVELRSSDLHRVQDQDVINFTVACHAKV